MKRRWFHGPNRRIVPPWIGFRRDGIVLSLAGLAVLLTVTAGIVHGTPHLRAQYDCLYRWPGHATCRIYGRCDYYGLQGVRRQERGSTFGADQQRKDKSDETLKALDRYKWMCQGGRMKIYGIDFTSRPRRAKPITCLECVLRDDRLQAEELSEWTDFDAFEAALRRPGPWIAGIDFPFGQARRFIETIGWPRNWAGYVDYAASLGRKEFRAALDAYRADRPPGDKEHRRGTDIAAGSISPQKLYGTPVGLMFFEGTPRLRAAGVTIPGLQQGDPNRIVVEAYPGILARAVIGRRSYKQDTKAKQTAEQTQARKDLLERLINGTARSRYGLHISAPAALTDDPGGDHLDALLCAIQAAWAWTQRNEGFGMPEQYDPLEGWIADLGLLPEASAPSDLHRHLPYPVRV